MRRMVFGWTVAGFCAVAGVMNSGVAAWFYYGSVVDAPVIALCALPYLILALAAVLGRKRFGPTLVTAIGLIAALVPDLLLSHDLFTYGRPSGWSSLGVVLVMEWRFIPAAVSLAVTAVWLSVVRLRARRGRSCSGRA